MQSMIRVPTSVEEFKPPKPTALITEAQNFQRAHWNELSPYYQMISGEAPSKHGSLAFDEAECAFRVKELAANNGYSILAAVKTHTLWKALRHAYKRNTGVTVRALEQQNKRLRIEHKQTESDAS